MPKASQSEFMEPLNPDDVEGITEREEFTSESVPEDFEPSAEKTIFEPIPDDVYQVEVKDVALEANRFYRPEEDDKSKKYQIRAEFVVIEDGEYYGRRLWHYMTPSLKPETKKGGTFLYKFVTSALGGASMSWEDCEGFCRTNKVFMKNMEGLIGNQLRVTVETRKRQDGSSKNAINAYMPIKQELPSYKEGK